MTRRALAVSVLGVVAPICLLAFAWVADRMVHHRSAAADDDDVLLVIDGVCGGPDSVEGCAPDAFAKAFGDRLSDRRLSRGALEQRWLAHLADGDHDAAAAAYGLVWLGSRRALPELRRQLLRDRYFYGWETSTPDPPDSVYADGNYPHLQGFAFAIEQLSGQPLRAAVGLSRAERDKLRDDAAGCDGWRAAVWLLNKLEGVPLPDTDHNQAKRLACEGPSMQGDPDFATE